MTTQGQDLLKQVVPEIGALLGDNKNVEAKTTFTEPANHSTENKQSRAPAIATTSFVNTETSVWDPSMQNKVSERRENPTCTKISAISPILSTKTDAHSVVERSSSIASRSTTSPPKTVSDNLKLHTTRTAEVQIPSEPSVIVPKQSQSKIYPQKQQQPLNQYQEQHKYSWQNDEDAVSKMVQNVFKLLEIRGPLTLQQLEYNLPIMIMASKTVTGKDNPSILSSTSITEVITSSNPKVKASVPEHLDNKSNESVEKQKIVDTKIPEIKKASVYRQKLIPENVVPEIIELLVTLGLVQQEATIINRTTATDSIFPRFCVNFGKLRKSSVAPSNIVLEITKAQKEVQASRQRQELLKEALSLPDQFVAEKVKQIVLQHPQVVDDPVYVTALRNLQVDAMLTSSVMNLSPTLSNSSKIGNRGRKRDPSITGTQAKKKRRRSKKQSATNSISVLKIDDNKATADNNTLCDEALSEKR